MTASKKTEFRDAIKRRVGEKGEKLWETLADIAEGKAWIPRLPDGREGPPQVPTTADRRAAATELSHMLYGKPVSQIELASANGPDDRAALASLTFEELKARAEKVIEARGWRVLSPARELPAFSQPLENIEDIGWESVGAIPADASDVP